MRSGLCSPRRLSRTLVCLVFMLVLSAAPTFARDQPSAGGSFHAGAPGVGDRYFPLYGNGGYDVEHYLLDISYDPGSDRLTGRATIRAYATEDLDRFNLDLQGLKVREVLVDGRQAGWKRKFDHELVITPARRLHAGDVFVTWVRYEGVPRSVFSFGTESGFIHTDDGALVVGEPEVAANWFPVNDHPIDKAAYTFVVTVPAGREVIANGHLVDHWQRSGQSTWVWEAREPMASYLATATIGQFDIRSYRTPDGLAMWDAIDPGLYDEPTAEDGGPSFGQVIDRSLSHQARIIDLLEANFGPYPFSAGGGIVDDYDSLFFALENQTRPIYSKYFFFDAFGGDFVIAHEYAHQWLGDSVAVAKWRHIWLNEGFATYAEWLWSEHRGFGTAQENFDFFYGGRPARASFWDLVIADPGPEALFDGAVYIRGAMTLQALRNEVGDADFFRILRTWASDREGAHGTTGRFIRHAESISGDQLDELFDAWLFTPRKPRLDREATARALAAASDGSVPPAAQSELTRYKR